MRIGTPALGSQLIVQRAMMIATGNSDNGLFIADYLTQDDLNYLAGKYPETLDKAVVLTAPDESRHLVRAATSHAYDCVTQHGSDDADCYSDSDNETTVMLVDSNSSLAGKPTMFILPKAVTLVSFSLIQQPKK